MSSLSTEPSIGTGTIITITASTILTGLFAYALYFDHRRRTDPEFRRQLKRDSKRSQKQAKADAEAATRAKREQIKALVEEVNAEELPNQSLESHEEMFMKEVAQGEALLGDETRSMEAALYFFRALKVYPSPEELMKIYDKTVPKHVIDILAEMVAVDNVGFARSQFSAGSSAAAEFDENLELQIDEELAKLKREFSALFRDGYQVEIPPLRRVPYGSIRSMFLGKA